MAVLAGADKEVITQDELIDILNQSGVRLALGQLVVAPETLEKWGTLRHINDGYQFAVPILRYWIQNNRKLSSVKEELNRIEPEADKLFKAAQVFYDKGNLDVALQTVNFTLEINPRHNDARILLGQINLDQGQLPEAVKILEEVYDDGKYSSGRHLLITTLLRLAETQRVENDQLATYERVLMIVPEHRVAKARRQAILDARRKRELAKKQDEAAQLAAQEDWAGVIGVYEALLQEFPEEADWQAELSKAQVQLRWQRQYNEAVGALETGDRDKGQELLATIIAEAPTYKQAARYLLQATEEIDVTDLQAQLQDAVPRPRVRHLLLVVGGITILLAIALITSISVSSQRINDQVTTFDATLTAQGSMFEEFEDALQIAQDIMTRQAATIAALIPVITPLATPTPTLALTIIPGTPTLPLDPLVGITLTRQTDGMVMVYAPAGTFVMGSDSGEDNEFPSHEVTLGAFWLDRTEVTNDQYSACVEDGACTEASDFGEVFSRSLHPVVGVSWYDAYHYCSWAGGQLPSEEQWEYAARGPYERSYPWGNEFVCHLVNADDETSDDPYVVPGGEGCDGFAQTAPVRSFSTDGDSWVGAADMAGNVWEWVADWYTENYTEAQSTEIAPDAALERRVMRGGSWSAAWGSLRTTYRGQGNMFYRANNVGFRCVIIP